MMVESDGPRGGRQNGSRRSRSSSRTVPAAARDSDSPSYCLSATEPIRGLFDVQQLLWSLPWLAAARRGDGHSVLVLPGLMGSDATTQVLRGYLRFLGYHVHGWSLGRNVGPTRAVLDELPAAVARIARESGGAPVSLVGWSLGGIYARGLAQRRPSQVRQVVTLGSPYRRVRAGRGRVRRPSQDDSRLRALEGAVADRRLSEGRLEMPATSIYSKWDGVVAWPRCIEPTGPLSENVQVRASHLGLGVDPCTLWVIADRLAQPAGSWRPFRPPLPLLPFFPAADEG